MGLSRRAWRLFLVGLIWTMTACAMGSQESARLAAYFQSPDGKAEWKQHDEKLKAAAEAAEAGYRQAPTMETLQVYEQGVRAYLDHGFLLYHALIASAIEPPKGFRSSLEDRALELMDIADEYLKLNASDILPVGIAREVIHKYGVGRMDRAQRRAEAIMSKYRYQRNY